MISTAEGHMMRELYENAYHETQVYPTLAGGVAVASANANWTYGAYVEIVPAATITTQFQVRSVVIENVDKNDVFQLQLYRGATDNLIATMRFVVAGGFWGNNPTLIPSEDCDANERIRARIACAAGAGAVGTATISITYQEH
jgi:hypothetical protein